jgi:hypothetical protein
MNNLTKKQKKQLKKQYFETEKAAKVWFKSRGLGTPFYLNYEKVAIPPELEYLHKRLTILSGYMERIMSICFVRRISWHPRNGEPYTYIESWLNTDTLRDSAKKIINLFMYYQYQYNIELYPISEGNRLKAYLASRGSDGNSLFDILIKNPPTLS